MIVFLFFKHFNWALLLFDINNAVWIPWIFLSTFSIFGVIIWFRYDFMLFYVFIKMSLLIYDLQSEDWINTYYMIKDFLKTCRPPKVSNEMKCTNEKMTWNTQDTNLSSYVPTANVDHTISGQETGISTLDHSATTPRANYGGNK